VRYIYPLLTRLEGESFDVLRLLVPCTGLDVVYGGYERGVCFLGDVSGDSTGLIDNESVVILGCWDR
jgi:hypothetical protein